VSLVLVIAAVLVLLRGLVQPVRRMTENMAALAGGDLVVATSAQSRLREISAMADAVGVFRDNTISLHQGELELQRTNVQFATALESMSQGLAMYDSTERLTVFNRRFCQVTGISPERVRLGMSYRDVLALGVEAGNFPGRTVQEVYVGSYHDQLAGGRAVAVRYEPMVGGGGWVSTFEDVTERRAAEARIAHMAHRDALSGLPNRFLLRERLEQVLDQARARRALPRAWPRPRLLQVDQRHARPPGGRRLAVRSGGTPAHLRTRDRHDCPSRWRRVRGGAGFARSVRECGGAGTPAGGLPQRSVRDHGTSGDVIEAQG
jgi:PAS domain-containing protein